MVKHYIVGFFMQLQVRQMPLPVCTQLSQKGLGDDLIEIIAQLQAWSEI